MRAIDRSPAASKAEIERALGVIRRGVPPLSHVLRAESLTKALALYASALPPRVVARLPAGIRSLAPGTFSPSGPIVWVQEWAFRRSTPRACLRLHERARAAMDAPQAVQRTILEALDAEVNASWSLPLKRCAQWGASCGTCGGSFFLYRFDSQQWARSLAGLDLLAAVASAEAFRVRQGRWPTLGELMPGAAPVVGTLTLDLKGAELVLQLKEAGSSRPRSLVLHPDAP